METEIQICEVQQGDCRNTLRRGPTHCVLKLYQTSCPSFNLLCSLRLLCVLFFMECPTASPLINAMWLKEDDRDDNFICIPQNACPLVVLYNGMFNCMDVIFSWISVGYLEFLRDFLLCWELTLIANGTPQSQTPLSSPTQQNGFYIRSQIPTKSVLNGWVWLWTLGC